MSSKSKKKVVNINKSDADVIASIEEMEAKIEGMKKDKNTKCKAAKEQLVSMLEITSDKYKTATGTAEALRVLRFTSEGSVPCSLESANKLAYEMAAVAQDMAEKAKELSCDKMDQLCDGFYAKEFRFDNDGVSDAYLLAYEMMRIDLCRNVGESAEDMVAFIKRVQGEIDATGDELKKLKSDQED